MAELTDTTDIRETVRERYAAAARAASTGAYDQARALESESGCCGSGSASCSPADETGVFGATLYDEAAREQVPAAAVNASLGCGVPTAVADLHEGETVLDLGSGAGADVLISARRVGTTGKAIQAQAAGRERENCRGSMISWPGTRAAPSPPPSFRHIDPAMEAGLKRGGVEGRRPPC